MKIKCIKAGNISFGGNVLSVTVGQEFPCDDNFLGLVDLYVDMFEKGEEKVVAPKAPEVIKAVEVIETPEVKEEVKSETLTEKAKKLFSK